MLLLVMNVWFLRAFNSSVGRFVGMGGGLSNGHGSIFLWLFCALAFLKVAQRFDSYLGSIGLNVGSDRDRARHGAFDGIGVCLSVLAAAGEVRAAYSAAAVHPSAVRAEALLQNSVTDSKEIRMFGTLL